MPMDTNPIRKVQWYVAFFSSVHSNYQHQFYAPDPQVVTMKDGTAELSKACHGRRTMRAVVAKVLFLPFSRRVS